MKQNSKIVNRSSKRASVAILTLVMIGAFTITSCKKDNPAPSPNPNPGPSQVVEVTGNITSDTRWTKDKAYKLKGFVRVGTDPSRDGQPTATATLTIEPGTIIISDPDDGLKDALIIQRGSRLIAEGTKEAPIIFTSAKEPGSRTSGDWGGLVICGRASNNLPGGSGELEGQYGAFHGGTNDADNSGILKFVRIEFAGIPVQPNQELNSLTLGSVGSGTVIENVQCSYGLDDGVEWFGGTVNCKNLVVFRGLDDDFDVDNGYRGRVQFAIGIRGANLADQSGSNGFEVDNDGSGSNAAPFTAPQFANVSIIGPKRDRERAIVLQFQNAAHLRRNNKIKIYNSFLTGYPNGIFLDNSGAAPVTANAEAGELILRGNILAGVDNWGGNGFGSAGDIFGAGTPANGANHPTAPRGFRVAAGTGAFSNGVYTVTPATIGSQSGEAWFAANNTILPKWQDAGIDVSIFDTQAPKLTPNAGSSLLSGTVTLPSGFEVVNYRGAFGSTDWTQGWVEWDPEDEIYIKK